MPHKGYEFLKALKRGELASHLYVLAGREELMMESALKILEEKLAPCDRKVYYIDEMTVQELLQSSSTGDLFGSSRKITVIKGIEKSRKKSKKQLLELFQSLSGGFFDVDNPLVIYIRTSGMKERKRNELMRNLRDIEKTAETEFLKGALFVEFPLLVEDRNTAHLFRKWIKNWFERKGIALDGETLEKLKSSLPPELKEAQAEMKKLLLYTDGAPPSPEDVEEVVSKSEEVLIKDLSRLIQKGDNRFAALTLKKLLDSGVRPNHILAYLLVVLARHLRDNGRKAAFRSALKKAERAVELEGRLKSQPVSDSLLLLLLSEELSR
ncbi:MAG: hypothetical protein J7K11_07305 [Candidatus Hydrothermae bacterium]|nr:hypothetical protein [Candidatus Hydrothermae bacterium]